MYEVAAAEIVVMENLSEDEDRAMGMRQCCVQCI